MKFVLVPLLALALGGAPFQCAADPDPERRIADTPAEALWDLSERFEEQGNETARQTTLEQLVERYPSSREAVRAQDILNGREPSDSETDSETETAEGEPDSEEAGDESES